MKRLYVFLMLGGVLLFGHVLQAQPVLTASTSNPSIGESFVSSTRIAPDFDLGAAGANVTWDFSGLSDSALATITFDSPGNIPNSSSFPSANIVSVEAGPQYGFLSTDASEQNLWGTEGPAGVLNYTNPHSVLRFPMTFNDTYNDTIAGTVVNLVPQTYLRTGTYTVTADAYGTLILPYGTFTDILRVHTTGTLYDTLSGTFPSTAVYEEVRCTWYSQNVNYPLFSYAKLTSTVSGIPFPAFETIILLDPASVDIEASIIEGMGIKLFPNPADTRFQLTYDLPAAAETRVLIHNLLGQNVLSTPRIFRAAGRIEEKIDIQQLERGMYLIELEAGQSSVMRKIRIE